MKLFYTLFVLILFSGITCSCTESYGDRVKVDNIEVYFLPPVNETDAQKIGDYFVEHHLASGERQSIQISKVRNTYILKMILSIESEKDISDQAKESLKSHAKQIGNTIFDGSEVRVEITDEHFETLLKIED